MSGYLCIILYQSRQRKEKMKTILFNTIGNIFFQIED